MISHGYLYVLCCACSFGIIPTLAKITYDEGVSPEIVVFFRILAGSIFMGIWSSWSYRGNLSAKKMQSFRAIKRPIAFLVLIIGICIVGMSLGYLGSYKYIPIYMRIHICIPLMYMNILINGYDYLLQVYYRPFIGLLPPFH